MKRESRSSWSRERWADHYEKRLLMLAGDSVQTVAVAALAYAASTGDPQAWQLVVAGVTGAGNAIFVASPSAMVPELVHGGALPVGELAA